MGILRDATLHFINQCFPTLSQRLHVSLSRGHVDSTDVVISESDPIAIGSLPLQIVDGTVSGLSLQLPWMNPRTAKFSVSVKSAHIRLAEIPFPNSQDLVFRALSDEILRSKFRNVAEAERNQARAGSSIRNFLSQVLERIELLVQDLAVVIEFADGSIGTLAIAKLRARRSKTEELPPEHSPTLLVNIEGVSLIICNSAEESELPLSVPEFSATLRITLEDDNLEADLDISRIVQVFIDSTLREWLQHLRLRQRKWILAHRYNRPSRSVREDRTAWIRYAFRRVSACRGLRRVRFDFDNVRRTLRRCAEYKTLHVRRLHKLRLNPEDISRIATLENIFDAEMILLLREAGKREVDANEISQFGTSEWLRWILFGHNISYEREKLAVDLTQSLEASADTHLKEKTDPTDSAQNQLSHERYAFHFRLNGLAAHMCSKHHDMNITLTDLGFTFETNSDDGQMNANLSLRSFTCSMDGDIAIQKIQKSTQEAHSAGETLLDVTLCSSMKELSVSINLHSLIMILHPAILNCCVAIFQGWMTRLPSLGYEDQIRCSSQSPQSISCVQKIIFTSQDTFVFVFGDFGTRDFKNSEVMAIMRKLEIRSVSRVASLSPEIAVSLTLQLSQVNMSSAITNYLERTADFPSEYPGQKVLYLSTDFEVDKSPALTVDISRADGFVDVPTMTRLSYGLHLAVFSQIMTVIPAQDDNDGCPGSENDPEYLSSQKDLTQSGLQLRASSVNVNVGWGGEGHSHDTVTLLFRQLETSLSPVDFSLVSLRVESIRLSSRGVLPILLQMEPSAGFQHALRLKRDFRSSLQGDFYEMLIGDISGHLSPDVVLDVVDLVLEAMSAAPRSARAASETKTLQSDERDSGTLLSLFTASLRIRWSDVRVGAELSCYDIQTTAEASRISGSVESVTLTEVDGIGKTVANGAVIVYVNNDVRKSNAPIRFLYDLSGSHVCLSNLTGSAKRSFWEPLILSIAGVCEKVEAKMSPGHEKKSKFKVAQAASEAMPVTIEGSEVTISFPHAPSKADTFVYADIHLAVLSIGSDMQRISLHRTSILLKNSSQMSGVKGARIMSTGNCEIIHKTKVPGVEQESSSLVTEVWEFHTPVEFAIALSPRSIIALQNALHSLLTPVQWVEPSRTPAESTNLAQDTKVDERFQFLFRCSIPLLRVAIGTKDLESSFNPFGTVLAEGLSLSIVDVCVGNSHKGFDIAVFTLLASVRTLRLSQNSRGSPDSLRIVIGGESPRYPPQNLAPQSGKGLSVRVLSRKELGVHATQYEISVCDVSAMHDSKIYENISKFVTDYLHLMNDFPSDTLHGFRSERESAEYLSEAERGKSKSQDASVSSSASSEKRPPRSGPPSVKVAIVISNFTYMSSIDHSRDSIMVALLRVQKAKGALLLSNVTHQEIKSSLRVEGVACFVEDIPPDVRGTDAPFGHRTSQELSSHIVDCMQVPLLLSPSIVVRATSHSEQKLSMNAGFVSLTFSNSPRNQLVVSIGNVSFEASIESLIHLCEVSSSFSHFSADHGGTESSNPVTEGLALRLYVQNASVNLSLDTLPVGLHENATVNMGIRLSAKYVSDDFFKTSEGFVRVSLDVRDNSSGHCDTLVSPCKISYRIVALKDWDIETKIEHLLRMSVSPITVRMCTALDDALRQCTLIRFAPDTSQALPRKIRRLHIWVHGIAVRCLSDTPRIQVLRVLIGGITLGVAFNESVEHSCLQFRIRDFVIEDTISWRLFRDDEKDLANRRWERILSSVRRSDRSHVAGHHGSTQSVRDGRLELDRAVPSMTVADIPLHSAVHFQSSWSGVFEDFKGLLSVSDVDLNLDLAAVPILEEWYNSLLRELPTGEISRSQNGGRQTPDLAPLNQQSSWLSELHIEPLTITGSIRATPRRLQQSLLERVLTGIFDVETVTGVSLHLSPVNLQGEQANLTTILHKVVSEYWHSAMSHQFLSGILAQSGKLTRLARIIVMSFFRQRRYNPLRLSTDKPSRGRRSHGSVGLLGALDSTEKENHINAGSSRFARPLVIHRTECTRGLGVVRLDSLHDSSTSVLDLT